VVERWARELRGMSAGGEVWGSAARLDVCRQRTVGQPFMPRQCLAAVPSPSRVSSA